MELVHLFTMLCVKNMTNKNMHIPYSLVVTTLLFSPLLMPSTDKDYSAIAVSIFVALCYLLKVKSLSKIVIPVIIFSIVMPITILLIIAKQATSSWTEAIMIFINNSSVEVWIGLVMPLILALIMFYLLPKIDHLSRYKE